MPGFSQQSLEKLSTCHPDLQRLFAEVIGVVDCRVIEGHRGKEAQDKAFAEGKSKLRFPQSKHNANPSLAVDVVPYPVDWNDRERFCHLAGVVQGVAHALGIRIRWGGDWNQNGQWRDERFVDMPHFELVG